MKIHEYQAKQILKRFGIDVPKGDVAFSSKEAGAVAARGAASRSPPTRTRRNDWRAI